VATFTFDDLIAWSEKLPPWQRDALRRVLSGDISPTDIAELATLAKAAQGFAAPGAPAPRPASKDDVPPSAGSECPVSLLSLRDITYVNALASGPVTFSPDGLTIIYGDNASGKSGIARILKKAAHAREPGGLIRPSVFEPDPGKPASAVIEFRAGSTPRSFNWIDGRSSTSELTRINVFDATCAAVQVEQNNRLAYTPEILQVFQNLAETCRAVGEQLKTEKDALDAARAPELRLVSLRTQTAASILLASLSSRTKPDEIDAICDVSDEERERHTALARALRDNPAGQADLLEARGRRLKDLDALSATLQNLLSDTTVADFEQRVVDADAAAEAASAARQAFAANSALPGLGAEAWKQLWESARRYSEELAYPAEAFPVTKEDALCVLCQQPIDRAAAQRLSQFERFVQDDIQQRAKAACARVQALATPLEALRIPISRSQLRDGALSDTPVAHAVRSFLVMAKSRRRYLLRRAKGLTANRPAGLSPRPDLADTRSSIAAEITRLRAAAQADGRRKMQNEFTELDDCIKLSPLKEILKEEVTRLRRSLRLERARNDCDTTGITRKGGDVAQIVVTAQLRSNFASHLSRLGFNAAPVEVKLGLGTVGQHPYRLSLIARDDVPPCEVLSEGEKTCVALAGFLAELETTKNGSGIILDDPISSLDHHYRVRVVRLLVEAAKERQVVVFTHDIVFLLLLTFLVMSC